MRVGAHYGIAIAPATAGARHVADRGAYRADIDGLRALAVIGIITFHAFPSVVGGGFIGVDVFFVISGYLITSIVHENLQRGTFSFADFYYRRIRSRRVGVDRHAVEPLMKYLRRMPA